MRVTLTRIESGDQGTFGKLKCGEFSCYTLELPWRHNDPDISCIPTGIYKCVWNKSTRFKKNMYEVLNVKDRAGIRIHAANLGGDKALGFRSQINGCISLGEKIGFIEGQKALLVSVSAIRRFETIMDGKPFELEISYDDRNN